MTQISIVDDTNATRRHGLPFILNTQAGKTVTHNEALARIDTTHHLCLQSVQTNAPPADPSPGDAVAIGADPDGAFNGHPHRIAVWEAGVWQFRALVLGMIAYVRSLDRLMLFGPQGWTPVGTGSDGDPASEAEFASLSVNTANDPSNRLSVKAPSVLFAADTQDGGDLRLSLNKDAPGDTASLLFQTDLSARAELGLAGDDRFRIKVSPDGTTFRTALSIDPDTGFAGFGTDPTEPVDIRTNADQVVRMALQNQSTAAGAGAAFAVTSGTRQTQLLQYPGGSAYFISSSSSFYYQLTGPSPLHRFYAGSTECLRIGETGTEFYAPPRLPQRTIADLLASGSGRSGDLVFVADTTSGLVYSDGQNWYWVRDDTTVS